MCYSLLISMYYTTDSTRRVACGGKKGEKCEPVSNFPDAFYFYALIKGNYAKISSIIVQTSSFRHRQEIRYSAQTIRNYKSPSLNKAPQNWAMPILFSYRIPLFLSNELMNELPRMRVLNEICDNFDFY